MKIHRIAEKVKGFTIVNNEVYWSSECQLLKLENGEHKCILKSKEKLQEIRYETPYLYGPDFYGNSYIVQTEQKYYPNIFVQKVISEDKLIVSYDKKTKLYNPITNDFKDLLDHRIFQFYRHQDFLISEHEKHIIAYSVNSGNTIWSQSIKDILGTYTDITGNEKEYRVTKFIGIIINDLVIQLTNSMLISINVETGLLSHLINLKETAPIPSSIFYDDYCHPSILGNKLIWLNNQRLMEVDVKNETVNVLKDYYNEPKNQQYRFMKNTANKDKILFVADKGWEYITPSRIGIMNSKDGKIIWERQLQKTGGLPEEPQLYNNTMYIRTANKTLYSIDLED